MNRYGRLAFEFQTHHFPDRLEIGDPVDHYTALGERIAAMVSDRRDEILGPVRPNESPEEYRLRGYQALRTAEELVLTEMVFEPAEIKPPEGQRDPWLTGYYEWLDEMREINPESFLEDPHPEELRELLEYEGIAISPEEIADWYAADPRREVRPPDR